MGRRLTLTGVLLCVGWALGGGCGPTAPKESTLMDLPPAERILAFESTGVDVEDAPHILQSLLRETCPILRAEGAQLLATYAAITDRPRAVLPALTHKDPLVRGMAQTAYIAHSRYGLAPLAMNRSVLEVEPRVLDALARMEDPGGRVDLPKVILGLQHSLRQALEKEPTTAVLAADILARVGDAGARRVLLQLVKDTEPPVLTKAIRATVRNEMGLGPTALPLAFTKGVEARRAVMRALVVSPDPRLEMLLRRGLMDKDEAVRRNAIRAIGNLGAAAPIQLLAKRLHQPGAFQADILQAMGVIGLPAADTLRQYIRAADDKTDPGLLVLAMMALAPNAGRQDIPWASSLLNDANAMVRAAAATVLGRTAHPEAQAALVAKCNDPHMLVRAAVAKALGQIGTIYAANNLLDMLNDSKPLVASMAAWGLGVSGYPAAAPALVKMMTTHTSSSRTPVRVGEMYGRPELAATEALGRIRTPQARKALRKALEAKSWHVRAAAADALRVQADRSDETIKALKQRLTDPVSVVRAAALIALESLGKTYEAGAFQAP